MATQRDVTPRETIVNVTDYVSYRDKNVGYCARCEKWTGHNVSPNAVRRQCPICGKCTVYGAEAAVLQDLIDLA